MGSIMRALGGSGILGRADLNKGGLSHANPGYTGMFNLHESEIQDVLKEPALYDAAAVGKYEAMATATEEGTKHAVDVLNYSQKIMQARGKVHEKFVETQAIGVKTHRGMETANRKFAGLLAQDALIDQKTRVVMQAQSDHAESFLNNVAALREKYRSMKSA